MVRRLEKIEKEMGYCDIKLEKRRRLRTQREFLLADLEALTRFSQLYESSDMGLRSLPYAKMAQQLAFERNRSEKPGRFFQRSREDFIAAGILDMVREDREVLKREVSDFEAKLESFVGFTKKRTVLEEERQLALSALAPNLSSRIRKLNETFHKVESQWNSLTEDSLNLDEGIFYLSRNADYAKSARSFLITAKGNFDIETWIDTGFTSDLFRHSNIGRAKEMLDGANRNLKLAQMEVCGTQHIRIQLDGFEPVLVEFLGALFDDIFLDGRLGKSIEVVEKAEREAEKVVRQARQKRETLHAKLERTEQERNAVFQRLGTTRGGRLTAE